MKLKCKNKRCRDFNNGKYYVWEYLGNSLIWASCPKCKSSVRVGDKK